jgi:acetyl/propionyl-CoA carboxylase alpha subunit
MPAISKLLVAGRGEIALRIMRTAHELGIATVAVFSDPDAGAPFVAAADEAVALPGSTPAQTYLRGDAIIAAAHATGAQAVHPGYGFLSENVAFARDCAQAGLIFVGPPAGAIEAMGSKIAAKQLMAAAGVPVLPGMTVPAGADGRPVAAGPRAQALDAERQAVGIPYPLLVKAAFGGGGRGMRIVAGPDELAEAVASAQREAASAFGDGTVFLERHVDRPRHIEVQIVGDSHGNVAHLFERECSIQRRYQKIIEEAPSPAVDDRLRAGLTAAAVAAGRAVGYVGAGTVEFVLDAGGSFYFLEMNTRLQVEHPVTELVTGLDLVAVQLAVAEGRPLPAEVTSARITGHAVEARLYAEDATAGFQPATGTVHRFEIGGGPGVRVDAGVTEGTVVTAHYDPMLAKVIAHGPTRDVACQRLARALARAQVHGVTTNRDLLAGVLHEAEFRAGLIDTGYLDRHDPAKLGAPPDGEVLALHAGAAALAGQARRRAGTTVLPGIPPGWRNVRADDQVTTYTWAGQEVEVRYQAGRSGVRVWVGGQPLPGLTAHAVTVHGVTADGAAGHGAAPGEAGFTVVDMTAGGIRRRVSVHRVGSVDYVDSPLGASVLTEVERFPVRPPLAEPGSLLAPMPGTVVRIAVTPGERIAAGAPVVVIEAMKMEHTVRAPGGGVVTEVGVHEGQAVDAGTRLARVEREPA